MRGVVYESVGARHMIPLKNTVTLCCLSRLNIPAKAISQGWGVQHPDMHVYASPAAGSV
jgi:hypothetical protein